MARLTVEDCLPHVKNRFDLVLLASKRARQIALGAHVLVPHENDKPTVLALREIASGLINQEVLAEIEAKERAAEQMDLNASLAEAIDKVFAPLPPREPEDL